VSQINETYRQIGSIKPAELEPNIVSIKPLEVFKPVGMIAGSGQIKTYSDSKQFVSI